MKNNDEEKPISYKKRILSYLLVVLVITIVFYFTYKGIEKIKGEVQIPVDKYHILM